MILHGDPSSGNVHKARMMLQVLGIDYEHVPTSWENGGTSSREFLKLNPNGKVPCLVDEGFILWESNAILCYLAEGTDWLPHQRRPRAQVMQWLFWEQYSHEPTIAVSRAIAHYEADPERRAARLASKREAGEHALQLMDDHLSNRSWFVGASPTIADLSLYAYTHVADEGGFVLDDYPHVQEWCQRVSAIPGVEPLAPFVTA